MIHRHCFHQSSDPNQDSHNFTMAVYRHHLFTVLLLRCLHPSRRTVLHRANYFRDLPSRYHHLQSSIDLSSACSPQKKRKPLKPTEPDINSERSSMTLASQANYTARYIIRLFSINISIVLQTVLDLGDSLCTYKFGSIGNAGAAVTTHSLRKLLYHWF